MWYRRGYIINEVTRLDGTGWSEVDSFVVCCVLLVEGKQPNDNVLLYAFVSESRLVSWLCDHCAWWPLIIVGVDVKY